MAQMYSLAARCGAEMIGTALVVAIGNAAVANAVLPRTKGHGMGYGWVCAAYGTGFSLAFVSAVLVSNAAMIACPAVPAGPAGHAHCAVSPCSCLIASAAHALPQPGCSAATKQYQSTASNAIVPGDHAAASGTLHATPAIARCQRELH
jgi:hypothetical protein